MLSPNPERATCSFELLCAPPPPRSLQQSEAALRGVVPEAANPEKLARATETLAKLHAQLANLRAAEAAFQPKVRLMQGFGLSPRV